MAGPTRSVRGAGTGPFAKLAVAAVVVAALVAVLGCTPPPNTLLATPNSPFVATVSEIPQAVKDRMWGSSLQAGCPVGWSELRYVTVTHIGLDGEAQVGELVLHRDVAAGVVEVFRALYDEGFVIERMELVDDYGGDDEASIEANNTSAFNCRRTTGGSSWSEHSFGTAIDVNPLVNPYIDSNGRAWPAASQPFVDRNQDVLGTITATGPVVAAFRARGWHWGGDWRSIKDYQHFSTTGR